MLHTEKNTCLPYPLQVGKNGEERLNVLNQLHNPYSQRFLNSAGITSSKKILDIGCGTGEMTCWLAQQTTGEVVAIDLSEEQIEIATLRAKKLNIKNIRFKQLSILDLDSLHEKFDFIYCRFLLVFLQNQQEVVNTIFRQLQSKGILALEEATVSASFCYPPSPVFDRWLQLWIALRKANNTVLDLGLQLPHMVQKAGCINIKNHLAQPVLSTTQEKRMLALNTREVTNSAINIGYAQKEEMEDLVNQLEKLAQDESRFIGYIRNTQVHGQKE